MLSAHCQRAFDETRDGGLPIHCGRFSTIKTTFKNLSWLRKPIRYLGETDHQVVNTTVRLRLRQPTRFTENGSLQRKKLSLDLNSGRRRTAASAFLRLTGLVLCWHITSWPSSVMSNWLEPMDWPAGPQLFSPTAIDHWQNSAKNPINAGVAQLAEHPLHSGGWEFESLRQHHFPITSCAYTDL